MPTERGLDGIDFAPGTSYHSYAIDHMVSSTREILALDYTMTQEVIMQVGDPSSGQIGREDVYLLYCGYDSDCTGGSYEDAWETGINRTY